MSITDESHIPIRYANRFSVSTIASTEVNPKLKVLQILYVKSSLEWFVFISYSKILFEIDVILIGVDQSRDRLAHSDAWPLRHGCRRS